MACSLLSGKGPVAQLDWATYERAHESELSGPAELAVGTDQEPHEIDPELRVEPHEFRDPGAALREYIE